MTNKYMGGGEFIKKIFPPYEERDFSKIKLQENFDLKPHLQRLNEYLRKEESSGYISKNPFNFEDSSIIGLKGAGLFMPHTILSRAEIINCDFSSACLYKSRFNYSTLTKVNFFGASLDSCVFTYSILISSNFREAIVNNSDFLHCQMNEGCIEDIDGLEKTLNLKEAIFQNIQAGLKEQEILSKKGSNYKLKIRKN